jgi:hypothetical protein
MRRIAEPKKEAVKGYGGHCIMKNSIICKVKVKLSLCLTKHHVMKMYWVSGSIAPRILDFGTLHKI